LVGSTKAYGYCTSNIVPEVDYFNGAIRFAELLKGMVPTLTRGGMGPTDHHAYTVMGMKTFISAKVLNNNKNIKVYISCETVNSSYVFLTNIHFCLDKRLNTFISCPTSTTTRGCGRGNNLVFPTTVITVI